MTLKKLLREIISEGFEGTQLDLLEEITKRGLTANQSSVSRALKNLNAQKLNSKWLIKGAPSQVNNIMSISDHVINLVQNEVLILIKTIPGSAHYVGSYLDLRKDETILGTVAGDDTILVIPAQIKNMDATLKKLHDYLGFV